MSNAVGIEISTSDGRTVRCAVDESSAWAIPQGITYSSTLPGGDDQCSFTLRQPIEDEIPFGLLDAVRIVGEGNRTLWKGLVAKMPRQSGDDFSIDVQCVGDSAKLKWDTGFKQIYVDRDSSHWGDPPLARKAKLALAGISTGDFSWAQSDGWTVSLPNQALGAQTIAELWYRLPSGVRASVFGYQGTGAGTLSGWVERFVATDDELATVQDGYSYSFNGNVTLVGLSTARSYLFAQTYSNTAALTPPAGTYRSAKTLAVYGDHGLGPVTAADGFNGYYGHDVLSHVLASAAPQITSSTGSDGSIVSNTEIVIPQLAFLTPTTAEAAILEINKYFGWEWGVKNGVFFWRPADPERLCWNLRLDQGIYLGLEGDDADNCANGVIVTYNLPDGKTKTAGPPGSGCDVEDASLGDSDPLNTVNAHGIVAKYIQSTVSGVTSDQGAIWHGLVVLAEAALPARKGSITITGDVEHPTKGMVSCQEIYAGDWGVISDHSSDVPRRIIQAVHNVDAGTCEISVGSDVPKAEAIFQYVETATQIAGF